MPKAVVLFQTIDAAGRVTFDFAGRILTDLVNVRYKYGVTIPSNATVSQLKALAYEVVTNSDTGIANLVKVVVGQSNGTDASLEQLIDDTGNDRAGFINVVNTASDFARVSIGLRNAAKGEVNATLLDTDGRSSFAYLGMNARSMLVDVNVTFAANGVQSTTIAINHNWNPGGSGLTKFLAFSTGVNSLVGVSTLVPLPGFSDANKAVMVFRRPTAEATAAAGPNVATILLVEDTR